MPVLTSIGTVGAAGGSVYSLVYNTSLRRYSLATGVNCAIFGGLYGFVREEVRQNTALNPSVTSGLAGAMSGGLLNGLYRGGRPGALQGAIAFGAVACMGQILLDHAPTKLHFPDIQWSKWSPLKRITAEEHARMLDKQMSMVDAQIASIDGIIDQLDSSS